VPALAKSKVKPVAHPGDREDFYVGEMDDGTRSWLAVPAGTAMRIVDRVCKPDAYRRARWPT
jgi:hypothetical protein